MSQQQVPNTGNAQKLHQKHTCLKLKKEAKITYTRLGNITRIDTADIQICTKRKPSNFRVSRNVFKLETLDSNQQTHNELETNSCLGYSFTQRYLDISGSFFKQVTFEELTKKLVELILKIHQDSGRIHLGIANLSQQSYKLKVKLTLSQGGASDDLSEQLVRCSLY